MNWDRVENEWQQVKNKVKAQWNNLTDHHLEKISGKREHLVNNIQECYGVDKAEAEHQVKTWESGDHDIFAETAAEVRKHVGIARQ